MTPGEGGYLAFTTRVRNTAKVPQPATLEEKWFSSQHVLQTVHAALENCEYLLNAIPARFINLGPGAMAPMLGGGYKLQPNTVWFDTDPMQCDFSAMISPAMFERIVLPSLEFVSSQISTSVYHLDGPGEIVHLDMILSVSNIHAIQWVPLPAVHLEKGNYHQKFDDEMSLDIYRRVRKAGRKIVLCGVPADQIERIFREVGSDGIFIFGSNANYQEATDLISKLCRDGWLRP